MRNLKQCTLYQRAGWVSGLAVENLRTCDGTDNDLKYVNSGWKMVTVVIKLSVKGP